MPGFSSVQCTDTVNCIAGKALRLQKPVSVVLSVLF